MFVARETELQLLQTSYQSRESQFIAVYGRRRIGKTVLIREAFKDRFTFQHAGLAQGKLREQLFAFSSSLEEAGLVFTDAPKTWLEAFNLLKRLIQESTNKRKVLFIDELSWMDTPRSGLLTALEWFWNSWASARTDIVLVVCASATSWMLNKVIHNKGGLYNRLTRQIELKPFTLGECEQLVRAKGIEMSRHQITECYMAMGGVPYYWNFLQKGWGVPQALDAIFFSQNGPLAHEFDYLFSSLFRHPKDYLAIVRALGSKKAGMTREEISHATKLENSGNLTQKLSELEASGFIRKYHAFGKKTKGSLFQLVDNYTLFYFKFLENNTDEQRWSHSSNSAAVNAWRGIAFERVCLEHISQIKRALGISGVHTELSSWQCAPQLDEGIHGSQIDLLIARKDNVINLCEMKFASGEYILSRTDEQAIRNKMADFLRLTHSKDALHTTLVTTYGLKTNAHSGVIQSVVTMNDLFTPSA
ncbi:MAG: ATP-binding protein [Atopobiaceae bacterium]|nr:ATP-binding protein [Atopobiaceae bacterium]